MTAPKRSVVTGVLVKNGEGKFLLVKKAGSVGPYAGTYLPPGGNIEPGERIDDAALRELYEETGVRVTNLRRAYFDDDITENWAGETRHLIGLLYTADYSSGNLAQTEGNDDQFEVVRWFSVDEIKQLPLSPPLQKMFTALEVL